MRRGELWTVAGSDYASKPGPVLIIQSDQFDGTDSVVVCPLTSVDIGATLFRIQVPATSATGLRDSSYIMIDKIGAQRRARLGDRLGVVNAATLVAVEQSLAAFLGFGARA